ncbi:MAG TPA: 6-phosphofructokinase, partial [Smithellaceae bacterium]|nr:6-phosphofructokinase [Smithellaceae bacterium]
MKENCFDLSITDLGKRCIHSPPGISGYVEDSKRILFDSTLDGYNSCRDSQEIPLSVELAGPRENIFFDPAKTKAAIVTCGGLCPGINDVIRSITMGLYFRYGVKNIIGIKYGFRGLNPDYAHKPVQLSPDIVKDITSIGGSILSCSRGHQEIPRLAAALEQRQDHHRNHDL